MYCIWGSCTYRGLGLRTWHRINRVSHECGKRGASMASRDMHAAHRTDKSSFEDTVGESAIVASNVRGGRPNPGSIRCRIFFLKDPLASPHQAPHPCPPTHPRIPSHPPSPVRDPQPKGIPKEIQHYTLAPKLQTHRDSGREPPLSELKRSLLRCFSISPHQFFLSTPAFTFTVPNTRQSPLLENQTVTNPPMGGQPDQTIIRSRSDQKARTGIQHKAITW